VGSLASRLIRVTDVPTMAPAGAISMVPAENPEEGPDGEGPDVEPQPAVITASTTNVAPTAWDRNRLVISILLRQLRRPLPTPEA
jgi:hypothetical protein